MSFDFNSASAVEPEAQQAPDTHLDQSAVSSEGGATTSAEQPSSILDLGSVEKFRFNDKEWTPKDLQSAILMQSDYTKKTQALSKEREYVSNFPVDLGHLAKDPSLLGRFKELYPESYHAAAEAISQRVASGQSPQQAIQQVAEGQNQSPQFQLPKEYLDEFNGLKQQVKEALAFRDEQVNKAVDAELSATYDKFGKKYPYADEERVTVWAQELNKKGTKLTDQVWEKIFEKSHKDAEALTDRIYKARIESQQNNSRKAFAGSPGGATPGTAPKTPKTIQEATRMLMESGQMEA